MIIATAGHVDHGKTALLHAVTGINTDRLPEEKQRGMTIDLGYAYWRQPDGRVIGFIDVPGHEKFLANMLAGVGGIHHALLVIACDDGVMAQTREHLAILQLLATPALTVALSKADRATDTQITQLRLSVSRLLAQMGWSDAAIFATSIHQPESIVRLSQHLRTLPAFTPPLTQQRFRLAIDRAFHVSGSGLVVTGSALSGQLQTGDQLWLSGANTLVRVRGLHAQNTPVHRAHAGQRIAVNITGNIEKPQIHRGDWLLSAEAEQLAGALLPVSRVIAELQPLTPLQHWQPLHIHHAASHITGRISLLDQRFAELRLDSPLWLADNDRLILRDISARHTLAGARVILPDSPSRGKRQPAFLHWLAKRAAAQQDAEVLALATQRSAVPRQDFAWSRQLTPHGLQQLLEQSDYLQLAGYIINRQQLANWQQQLLDSLAHYHQRHTDEIGVSRQRLRRMALPALTDVLADAVIDQLQQAGRLLRQGGFVCLPEQQSRVCDHYQTLWQQVSGYFADEAWWLRDLAQLTATEEPVLKQVLHHAARRGLIHAIVKDRYYQHQRIVQFAGVIYQLQRQHGCIPSADFRDSLHVGRKLAIQILEYFDRIGFTRRRANQRILNDASLFNELAQVRELPEEK